MKKFMVLFLAVCTCLFIGIMFTACDEGSDHEHTYGEWSEVKAATCSEKGKREKVCSCGEKVTEDIEVLAHTEETVAGKAATCTEAGYTESKKCSVCQTVIVAPETINATGHSEEVVVGKAATCTESGLTDGKKCTVCDTVTVEQSVIPAAHTEETVPGKVATCTENGLSDGKKCSVCQTVTVEQTVIPASHTEETVPGKAATCTEAGLTDGKKCSVCQTVIVAQTEIDAKRHTEETVPGKAATCTEAGLTDGKKCTACGTITVEQEPIGVTAHPFSSEWEHDETYHWHKCTACSEIEDKTTHNWDAGVITTPPTTESEGEKKLTCTDCGETKNEAVPVVQGGKVNSATEWDAAMNYSGNYIYTRDMYWADEGEELWYMGQQVTTHYGNIIKIDDLAFYAKDGDKCYCYTMEVRSDDGGDTYYEIWEKSEYGSFYFDMYVAPFGDFAGHFDSFTYSEEDGYYYAEDLTIGRSQYDVKIKIENGKVVECIVDALSSYGTRLLSEYAVEYRDVELTLPSLEKMPHTCSQGYWQECAGDSAETHHIGVCGGCECEIAGTVAEHTWDSGKDTGDGVIYTCTDCGYTKEEETA